MNIAQLLNQTDWTVTHAAEPIVDPSDELPLPSEQSPFDAAE
jgi:hypothetical protein